MSGLLKVLHYSTHNEECGVAKYQEQYIAAMRQVDSSVVHDFFELSPNEVRIMNNTDLAAAMRTFKQKLQDHDVLHIQHETGLYSDRELSIICETAKALHKRLVVTVHAAPLAYVKPVGSAKSALLTLKPRVFLGTLKAQYSLNKWFKKRYLPLKLADAVLVHNTNTRSQLLDLGFSEEQVIVIDHPVQEVSFKLKSDSIAKALDKEADDVIYCTVGWIHDKKGVDEAVKALSYLPENYKLAVIGGIHGQAGNDKFLNKLCDLIDARGLKDRVYITGSVESNEEMDAMIRECNMAIYPYDKTYYAQVSSGALNLAIANLLPVVAYPVQTFLEMRDGGAPIHITQNATYYELARVIKEISGQAFDAKASKEYKRSHSFSALALEVLKQYK